MEAVSYLEIAEKTLKVVVHTIQNTTQTLLIRKIRRSTFLKSIRTLTEEVAAIETHLKTRKKQQLQVDQITKHLKMTKEEQELMILFYKKEINS